jgi:hypothetical protein
VVLLVVWLVVGVVMVQSANKPLANLATASLSVERVLLQSVLSRKYEPIKHSIFSSRPSGPVTSVIMLLRAVAVSVHVPLPPPYLSRVSPSTSSQASVPDVKGQAPSNLFIMNANAEHFAPPKKFD